MVGSYFHIFTHPACRDWIRSFCADYGAPIMVVVWSAAGYIAADVLPGGEPRQVATPNAWEVGVGCGVWSVGADALPGGEPRQVMTPNTWEVGVEGVVVWTPPW